MNAQQNEFEDPLSCVAALLEDDDNVRNRAARMLGADCTDVNDAVAFLITALRDKDKAIRDRAEWALKTIDQWGKEVAVRLVETLIRNHGYKDAVLYGAVVRTLESIGPEAVTALLNALREEDIYIQYTIVHVLGSYFGPSAKAAVPTLAALSLGTSHPLVSEEVFCALKRIGPEAIQILFNMLTSQDINDRRIGACSLNNLVDDKLFLHLQAVGDHVVETLANLMHENDKEICQAAAQLLGRFGPAAKSAMDPLIFVLRNRDNRTRIAVVRTLESIGPEARDAVSDLVVALQDKDEDVRIAAARALGAIGPEARVAIDILTRLLCDKVWSVPNAAAQALKSIGPEAVPALIKEIWGNGRSRYWAAEVLEAFGPESRDAVNALVVALGDKDEHVRFVAAKALGAIGPEAKEAINALVIALTDEEIHVRKCCASAILSIGPEMIDAVDTLTNILRDRNDSNRWAVAGVLGSMGSKARYAVPALADALLDRDGDVRIAAAKALGTIGPVAKAALPTLVNALQDKDKTVAQSAAQALESIEPGGKDKIIILSNKCDDTVADIYQSASDFLRPIRPEMTAAADLLAAIKDKYPDVIRSAAWTMRIYGPEIVSTLAALQKETSTDRKEVAQVLMQINADLSLEFLEQSQSEPSGVEWDAAAGKKLRELKIFYLVFRAYMEGADSMITACKMLTEGRYNQLKADRIPQHYARFAPNIKKLTPLFAKILNRPNFSIFTVKDWNDRAGESYKFTEDAQDAWKWTDDFLRRQPILKDWFGFSWLEETE